MKSVNRIRQRLSALDGQIQRGCGATRVQSEVELMVTLAEECAPLLALNGKAPEPLRQRLTDLAAVLSDRCEREARLVEFAPGATVEAALGVRIATNPTTVLVTHTSMTAVLAGSRLDDNSLIEDGHDPRPLVQLDGTRARIIIPGLLRLLEREARSLDEGDDANWGDENGKGDEHWHPNELLRRVRRLRRDAARLTWIREVHDA